MKVLIFGGLAALVGISVIIATLGQMVTRADTPTYQLGAQFGHSNYFSAAKDIASAPDGGFAVMDTNGYFGRNQITRFDATSRLLFRLTATGTGDGQLNYPTAIAMDASGNTYVGDQSGRIQKFDASGAYVSKFGTPGIGAGQLGNHINSIAIDSQGNFYVVDSNSTGLSDRIQKFDANGNFVRAIGSKGSGVGQFNSSGILRVAVSSNALYAADLSRVQKFDLDGTYLSQFGTVGTADNQIAGSLSIAVGSDGTIGVVSRGDYTGGGYDYSLKYFDQNATYLGKSFLGNSVDNITNFSRLAAASDGFYVLRTNEVRQRSVSGLDQSVILGNGDSSINSPTGITTDASGNVYVADRNNARVQKFSRTGTLLATIPLQGIYATGGLTVDAGGNIYAEVYDNNTTYIRKFDPTGTLLWQQTISTGYSSTLVTTDGTSRLYVASTNYSISIYDLAGNLLSTFGSVGSGDGQFSSVNIGGMVYSHGSLYVQDSARVQEFTADGTYVRQALSSGSFGYAFLAAIDPDGNFMMAATSAGRVTKYSPAGSLVDSYVLGPSYFALAIDAQQSFFVLSTNSDTVTRYDRVMIHAPELPPTNIQASNITRYTMTLNWTAPAEGQYSQATLYKVRARAVGASTDSYSATGLTSPTANLTGLAGGTEYQLFVSAGNIDGYGPEAMITARTLDGPVRSISDATFSEADGKKLLTVTGTNLVGTEDNPNEWINALNRSLVKLNGQDMPFCSGVFGTAQQMIDTYSPYYPNIGQLVSDNPPCYLLVGSDSMPAITSTQAIIVLPPSFDTTAQGTVSVNGSPIYTFNKIPNVIPTVVVSGAPPISDRPKIPKKPVFSGVATPHSTVVVTVHSDPVTCQTVTSATGQWSCALDVELPAGDHTVQVKVTNPDNSVVDLGPYTVVVAAAEVPKPDQATVHQQIIDHAQSGKPGDTGSTGDGDEAKNGETPPKNDTPATPNDGKSSSDTAVTPVKTVNLWWVWPLVGLGIGLLLLLIVLIVRRRRKNQQS